MHFNPYSCNHTQVNNVFLLSLFQIKGFHQAYMNPHYHHPPLSIRTRIFFPLQRQLIHDAYNDNTGTQTLILLYGGLVPVTVAYSLCYESEVGVPGRRVLHGGPVSFH